MIRASDEELEALLSDLESDRVERKESWRGSAPTKGREALCAFANDLTGHARPGILFVGVRDDGEPTGLEVSDDLLLQIASMKTDGNIVPPPTMTVEKRVLRGAELVVVSVEPADAPPVRYKGRIHVRTGPRRATATAQDERILNERRRHGDKTFDVRPIRGARISDLNLRLFDEEYLPQAFAPDVLEANERSTEERLAATKMIAGVVDTTPTGLGVLVLSSSARDFIPAAYVQFLRIGGTELSDPILDAQAIDGTISEVIRRTEDKLVAHNRQSVDFTSSPKERRTAEYPLAALQQLVRNALMHRTYEHTNAPVRVSWYDDRIEIWNAGGAYGAVTAATFGRPGIADYRNPALAEALRVLGYVQRFGVGIATARASLEANGNPPLEFDVQPTYVLAILRRRKSAASE